MRVQGAGVLVALGLVCVPACTTEERLNPVRAGAGAAGVAGQGGSGGAKAGASGAAAAGVAGGGATGGTANGSGSGAAGGGGAGTGGAAGLAGDGGAAGQSGSKPAGPCPPGSGWPGKVSAPGAGNAGAAGQAGAAGAGGTTPVTTPEGKALLAKIHASCLQSHATSCAMWKTCAPEEPPPLPDCSTSACDDMLDAASTKWAWLRTLVAYGLATWDADADAACQTRSLEAAAVCQTIPLCAQTALRMPTCPSGIPSSFCNPVTCAGCGERLQAGSPCAAPTLRDVASGLVCVGGAWVTFSPDGAACVVGAPQCNLASACDTVTHLCAPLGKKGEPCEGVRCRAGLTCIGGICADPFPKSVGCASATPCPTGSACAGSTGPRVCAPKGQPGDPCSSGSSGGTACLSGICFAGQCRDVSCAPPSQTGEACWSNRCAPGLTCTNVSKPFCTTTDCLQAFLGCSPSKALGEPCTLADECGPTAGCDGTCKALPTSGAPCLGGRCAEGAACVGGVCGPPSKDAGAGSPCHVGGCAEGLACTPDGPSCSVLGGCSEPPEVSVCVPQVQHVQGFLPPKVKTGG